MEKKIFMNAWTICLIGVLLIPITSSAHREIKGEHSQKVHRVIEVLYALDPEDIHRKVLHDHNNYGVDPHNNPKLCDGYEGGHSGYDVAHEDDDASFYSLTDGKVIKVVHPNPKNKKVLSYIAIYNATHDRTTLYLHPSKIFVGKRDTVKVGRLIGKQGNTGNSRGPHVHLEVRKGWSEFPSCGIAAARRIGRPNENPIPFLFQEARNFVHSGPRIIDFTSVISKEPDFVIESIEAIPATLEPGEKFRLYATLKNQGTETSEATILRYYSSRNDRITLNDEQLGRGNRDPLAPNETIRRYLPITVPTTPGTYYYGVCVDAVNNESNTGNNCSEAIKVRVHSPDTDPNDADVNGNSVVDIKDLIEVAEAYGQKGINDADVNGDRIVDIKDLILVAEAIDDAADAPALQSQIQPLFTAEQLQELLTEAKALGNISPRHQRGIAFLEQLFRLSTPKKTSLLPNYPNPFNPETWIPYQLATSSNVKINIYNAQGVLVRVLPLGHQSAGYYMNRSRSAYWNGRNTLGEPVASGVYYYQLETDGMSLLRKMVILK